MDHRRLIMLAGASLRAPLGYAFLTGKTADGVYVRLLGHNENGGYERLIGKTA